MDESGSSSEVSVADTRQVFERLDDPGAPLATAEVADELDCPAGAASRKLETLAERGALKGRRTVADERVWWRPADRGDEDESRGGDEEESRGGDEEAIDGARREEEFRTFVQAVEDYAMFLLDPDGHIQTWNEGAERIKGYSEEEILGEHLSLFYPDDDAAAGRPAQLLEQAAADGSVQDEGWRVREDGGRFWAHVTITALYHEDGELRGYAKITRDLTERHEREEELERERDITEQFRLLVENVEEYAIFMTDPDGHIQSWNAGAEKVKGYTEAEILGEHISVFYPDDAVEAGVPDRNFEAARMEGHVEDEGWRVREDGERFWANVNITAIRDDEGELRGFAKVTRDMTERHEFEEQLRREKERFQRMVESIQDYAIFMLDPEGHIETWNEGAERIKGYSEEEILGEHLSLFYPEDGDASPDSLLAQAAAQGRVAHEGWRVRKDGSRFWASVVITALYDDDGDLRGFAKVTRDLTERKRREDRLTALDEMGRALLEADSHQAVCDIVRDAAADDLDLTVATIALYDDESGTLKPTARTERAERLQSDVPFLNPTSNVPWEAFGGTEPLVVDDLARRPDGATTEAPVSSGVIVPMGKHGVFIAGFASEEPSDEAVEFVKVVAADLEAALDNTERRRLLREREATLAEQNERLERVNRINDVIRTIDQALIDASTRSEVERVVCDELATAGPYRAAWIGRQDPATDSIIPEVWAGIESEYVDHLASGTGDGPRADHPANVAARLREPIAVQDVRSDPPFERWRKEALKRGYRSMIGTPIQYEGSLYGVLTVQADSPDTFTGMEAQVIEELGETVAHAVNALESKQAIVSDRMVELEFRVGDPSVPILRMADQADCAVELDHVLSRADGSLGAYFTARGASPDDIEAFVGGSLAFSDLRIVAEGDEEECLFEATVSGEGLVATLVDHGAEPRTISAEDGEARVVAALPTQADVREFVEMMQARYSHATLTARRTSDRSARTPQDFRAAFEERITDRQREVLQTAFFSGYFDTPRKNTGEEIGEALGVSQPTVNHHLRACHRTLVGMLYDEAEPAAAALDT